MNRFHEITQQFEIQKKKLETLKSEYVWCFKGDVYQKRYLQITTKMKDLNNKALNLGCNYSVAIITGKRRRPNKRTPSIMVVEPFSIYFVAVTDEEAMKLVKLHVKNAIEYTIRFIRSGNIITASK